MKIGFDVSQTAEEKSGCGFFADQLIRNLVSCDRINRYILYPIFYSYRNPAFHKATLPVAENCTVHFQGMPFGEICSGWDTVMADRSGWLGSPDIIHSNNFSCEKDHRAKIVYTLYDTALITHPDVTTEANRKVCLDGLLKASLHADHCIAISEATKRAFLTYFPHYPEERITVVHLGTRPNIRFVTDPMTVTRVLARFGLAERNFWLGVGTVEPRKNYRLLISAFHALNNGSQLVIAGGKGWLESDLGQMALQLGLKDRVKFVGYVSDEELSVLYSNCFAFVYPSLYEGFGLPVLEAMSCGAAVITSDSSSLPEVGGDAALYIDPLSVESLIEKMTLLSEDEKVRTELRSAALRQATEFSWSAAARKVRQVYELTVTADFYGKGRGLEPLASAGSI